MDRNENGLRRRNLLRGAAALFATKALPAPKAYRALLSLTANMSDESIQVLSVTKVLSMARILESLHVLNIHNTAETLQNEKPHGFISYEEMFGENGLLSETPKELTPSQRLAVAWQGNIDVATNRLLGIKNFEPSSIAGFDIIPRTFFELLANEEARKNIAATLVNENIKSPNYEISPGEEEQEWIEMFISNSENTLRRLSKLIERYPSLKDASSMKELIVCMRRDIADALTLPLENGCFDRLEADGGIEQLQMLIDEGSEFFPPNKLHIFRHIVKDLRLHGRQTVRLEDIPEVRDDWQYHGSDLPHRLGLTPLQANFEKLTI